MEWIITPGVALLLSSFVAYQIYTYRSLVTFKSVSIARSIALEDGTIKFEKTIFGQGLAYTYLDIQNHGLKNVKDFLFSSEETFVLRDYFVSNTTSIDAGSISVEQIGDRLLISCPSLPKKEKVSIEIVTDRKLHFWKVRGQGDQYRLESDAYLEGFKSALSIALWIISIFLILSLTGALIGLLAAQG